MKQKIDVIETKLLSPPPPLLHLFVVDGQGEESTDKPEQVIRIKLETEKKSYLIMAHIK